MGREIPARWWAASAGRKHFCACWDIEIAFGREGRSGARMIRMSALRRSRSRALGTDLGDAQNDQYRVNGQG